MFISVGSKRLVNHVFIFISEKRLISLCVGCGNQIHDQYILRVSPDLEWHAACLKCAECNQYLDESCTCFVRDGKTYCKRDYIRYAIYTASLILWDFPVFLHSLFVSWCGFVFSRSLWGPACKSYPVHMLHKLNYVVHFTVYEKDPTKPNSSFHKLCGIEACLIALGICHV